MSCGNIEISDVFEKDYFDNIDYSIVKGGIIFDAYQRIFDIIFSLLGCIVAVPLVLIAAIFIKIEDRGPIFYKQERVGKKGKRIFVYKLRSMRTDAEKFGMQWAEKDDPRITKTGKFIRKTRIDELPQIINILKGDMGIIGPRPERPEFTKEFNEDVPGFINRLAVKPGLTGLAQVSGGYDMTPEEKLVEDMKYIENRSVFLDIKILFKTVSVVLTGDGAR